MPRVVSNGPRDIPQVALTFDDGPDPAYTPRVLDILEQFGAPATFFIIGQRGQQMPEALQRMVELGCEVGSHAWSTSHLDLRTLTPRELTQSLLQTHEFITEATGQAPVTFRPPYGFYDSQVLATANRFGYTTVLWDVDSLDWQSLTAQQVLANVTPNARNGSIILMHDGTTLPETDLTGTVEALPTMIAQLRDRGLELVTVQQMLGLR